MTIKLNVDWTELDETITDVDVWYDRHTRLWVIQKLNKDGYQIGDSVIVYGKKSAMKTAEEIRKEYNI